MMNFVIHAAGVANFGYALYYDLVFVHLPAHLRGRGNFSSMVAFPGKWKYLTVWNTVLQLTYHSVALLNDIVGDNGKKQRGGIMKKIRDLLFSSWAFPVGMFVSISFWGLYTIDRALVFPMEMDEFYPTWLNHAVHTAPILFLITETVNFVSVVFWSVFCFDRELMFPAVLDTFFPIWLNHAVHTGPIVLVLLESIFVEIEYPKDFVGVTILVFGVVIYVSWITWVNMISGVWAYPILDVLNNYQRTVFLGGSGIAILGIYFMGEKLNNWRWGNTKTTLGKAKSSKSAKSKSK